MNDVLFWHNCEVRAITPPAPPATTVVVHLSAAAIERDEIVGFLSPLELVFEHATLSGVLTDCVGALSDAEWHVGSQVLRSLPLPWHSEEPVRLTLMFRNGSTVSIEATSAHAVAPPDARFMESYAC